jgi:hypothetical protein
MVILGVHSLNVADKTNKKLFPKKSVGLSHAHRHQLSTGTTSTMESACRTIWLA